MERASVILLAALLSLLHVEASKPLPPDQAQVDQCVASQNGERRARATNVDKPIANMHEMEWDATLAAQAQAWTDTCNADPVENQITGVYGYAPVGGDSSTTVEELITGMVGQTARYDTFTDKCGPFGFDTITACLAAMLWPKNTRLGCGITECDNVDVYGGPVRFVACLYNEVYESGTTDVFAAGAACSACDDAAGDTCSGGLCVTPPPEPEPDVNDSPGSTSASKESTSASKESGSSSTRGANGSSGSTSASKEDSESGSSSSSSKKGSSSSGGNKGRRNRKNKNKNKKKNKKKNKD